MLNGKFSFLFVSAFSNNADSVKQVNGIAPNFIHSLDSCHMMKMINRANAEGISSFHCVHDSFGTHAADIERLSDIVKEEFISIYSEDVLENFKKEIELQTSVDLELPDKGELDLEGIRDSDFFFS